MVDRLLAKFYSLIDKIYHFSYNDTFKEKMIECVMYINSFSDSFLDYHAKTLAPNPFAILELHESASDSEIKKRFFNLAR